MWNKNTEILLKIDSIQILLNNVSSIFWGWIRLRKVEWHSQVYTLSQRWRNQVFWLPAICPVLVNTLNAELANLSQTYQCRKKVAGAGNNNNNNNNIFFIEAKKV